MSLDGSSVHPAARPAAASAPRPSALGRCHCVEQDPRLSASGPFAVEVCLNCDGVIAVWRRSADLRPPGP